jgi:hypothetical protein
MSRELSTTVSNAIDQEVVQPFFAVDIDFDSGPLYVWSGYGDLAINTKVYLGAGDLLNISSLSETVEMEAKGATISMSGIPSSFLNKAQTEPYQGREVRIYFGVTDNPAGYVEVFSGELDQMNIDEGPETSTVIVTAENILVKLERPITRRFSNADQQSRFSGDKGLEFVADLQDKQILWGRTAS